VRAVGAVSRHTCLQTQEQEGRSRMNEVAVTPESAFTRPADIPRTCTDEALLEAVGLWLIGSDGETVARKLGVSVEMAGGWTQKRGWKDVCARLRDEVRMGAHSGMTRCIALGLKAIEDRILYGDLVEVTTYDGDGVAKTKVMRKPLPAWQLGNITDKLVNRQLMLEDRLAGKSGHDPDSLSVRELAAALARLAQRKPENFGKTIEGELGSQPA
jgi:hypothetical protein